MLDLTASSKRSYRQIMEKIIAENDKIKKRDLIQEPVKIHKDALKAVDCICPFCGGKYPQLFLSNFKPINKHYYDENSITDTEIYYLQNDIENKIILCSDCLEFKRTDYSIGEVLMINPISSRNRVQVHFFYSEDGFIRGITEQGQVTVKILGLNRSKLVEERKYIMNIDSHKQFEYFLKKKPFDPNNDFEAKFIEVIRQIIITSDTTWYDLITPDSIQSLKKRKSIFLKKYESDPYMSGAGMIFFEGVPITTFHEFPTNFRIENVQIDNFKNISDLNIEFIQPSENKSTGQWTCILGENGSGKTSILQAIALSLVPRHERTLNIKKIRSKGHYRDWNVTVHSQHFKNEVYSLSDTGVTEESYPLVIAYGSVRLSDGINSNKPDKNHSIRNLFNPRKSLENPEQFLLSLSNENFQLITNQIKFIFNEKVTIRRDEDDLLFSINHESFEFRKLSDGYKIILSLVCDIISTINKRYKSYEGEAIVLIDELENHLHPKWIIELPNLLKSIFPYVQFITTSHNPLAVRQLKAYEVLVISKSVEEYGEKNAYSIQSFNENSSLSLNSIDYLLTSSLFELYDTNPQLNKSIEQLYEKIDEVKNMSFDEYTAIIDNSDLGNQFSGSTRNYYIQYLIDKVLNEERKGNQNENLLSDIDNLIQLVLERENDE